MYGLTGDVLLIFKSNTKHGAFYLFFSVLAQLWSKLMDVKKRHLSGVAFLLVNQTETDYFQLSSINLPFKPSIDSLLKTGSLPALSWLA